MGAAQFDRQVFTTPQKASPRDLLSTLGPAMFAGVLVIVGLIGYKVVSGSLADGAGSIPAEQLSQIRQQLATAERRPERIERRRLSATREPSTPLPSEQKNNATVHLAPPLPAPRVIYRITQPPSQKSLSQLIASRSDSQLTAQRARIDSLQSDMAAGREEWEATASRLGSAVGELGSQRVEIDRSKETLNHLLDRFERQELPFSLQKKGGRKRVGPVALRLEGTDPENGRYTLRLQVNDQWVELRNRASNEAVEFYAAGSSVPLELVVNQVGKNEVRGKIDIPQKPANR